MNCYAKQPETLLVAKIHTSIIPHAFNCVNKLRICC